MSSITQPRPLPSESQKRIGSSIQRFREERGLTVAQLAGSCGMPEARLIEIEAGYVARLTLTQMFRIFQHLGVMPSTILDGNL